MFGFNLVFSLFPIFFGIILILFIVQLVRGIAQWHTNNQSPRLSVTARVVAKRTETHHHHHDNHMHTSTSYYVTFEFDSGDRMEFSLRGSDYGMLAEGDRGTLSFQGTRFLDFTRKS